MESADVELAAAPNFKQLLVVRMDEIEAAITPIVPFTGNEIFVELVWMV